MVSLNKDAVGKVARALITLNGKTTTLEVKLALRKLGFYATQDEVRYLMLDITSKDGDVVYTDNVSAGYRSYSFRDAVLPTPSSAPQTSGTHLFNTLTGVCKNCGCSFSAVKHFKWEACKPAPKNVTTPAPKVVTASTNAARVLTNAFPTPAPVTLSQGVHRDNVKANYVVRDVNGNFPRMYVGVTRAEAKRQWEQDTRQPFTSARTEKQ